MDKEVNVVLLMKDEEQYIFLFQDAYKDQCKQQFIEFAANNNLSFNWQDANELSSKVEDIQTGEDSTNEKRHYFDGLDFGTDRFTSDDDGHNYW